MTPLQAALADYDQFPDVFLEAQEAGPIVAAARLLAEGETIWWCEEHERAMQPTDDLCIKAPWPHRCKPVEKILADPPDKGNVR